MEAAGWIGAGLEEGLYEDLVTLRIRERVDELVAQGRAALQPVEAAEQPSLLARHVAAVVERALDGVPVGRRVDLANEVLLAVGEAGGVEVPHEADVAKSAQGDPRMLLEVLGEVIGAQPRRRPELPLRRTDLLVNDRGEPSLAHEIAAEVASADRVDLLCAFVKWSGLRLVVGDLEEAARRGVPIRVLTTTYVGATEPRALDRLVELGAEVRISYEIHRTRLHAKAWLFGRRSGLDTAYVGSSNLSRAALVDGLEWNVRLSRAQNPVVVTKFAGRLPTATGPDAELEEKQLLPRLHKLVAVDDRERAHTWQSWLQQAAPPRLTDLTTREQRLAAMLVFNVWNDGGGHATVDDAMATLWRSSAFRAEALELLAIVAERIAHVLIALPDHFDACPLWVHGTYSREELLAGLGYATITRTPRGDQTGVRYVENLQADVFTSTINKTPGRYSPTTMYRDYPLSDDRFHWESQNATAVDSPVGQRYIHHAARGGWVLLFARLEENDEVGTAPFLFLGPATYESHSGSKPIAIIWRLHHRLPPGWFAAAGVLGG